MRKTDERWGAPVPLRWIGWALVMLVLGGWFLYDDNPFAERQLRGVGFVLAGAGILATHLGWRRGSLMLGAGCLCIVAGYAWRYGGLLVDLFA